MAHRHVQVVDVLSLHSGAKQVGVETKTQVTASDPADTPQFAQTWVELDRPLQGTDFHPSRWPALGEGISISER